MPVAVVDHSGSCGKRSPDRCGQDTGLRYGQGDYVAARVHGEQRVPLHLLSQNPEVNTHARARGDDLQVCSGNVGRARKVGTAVGIVENDTVIGVGDLP